MVMHYARLLTLVPKYYSRLVEEDQGAGGKLLLLLRCHVQAYILDLPDPVALPSFFEGSTTRASASIISHYTIPTTYY